MPAVKSKSAQGLPDAMIPKPVLLNCWKHHLDFIVSKINEFSSREDLPVLKDALLKIGKSTTDLYSGKISPARAARIAIDLLKKNGFFSSPNYIDWISGKVNLYRSMIYPDRSVWVFRIGIDPGRYIHIHPGRGAPHTRRVKASVLKTAICVWIDSRSSGENPWNMDCINRVRKKYLGLSPVKNFNPDTELGKMLSLIESRFNTFR